MATLQKETSERIEITAGTSNTIGVSASETKFVKQAILEVEEEIVALNAEIAQRTTRLQRLRAAIAPHKRLPLEVLTHIFMFTLECPVKHPDDNWYLEIPLIKDAPWSLRQVCSSWRQAALKHYQLWSKIRVGQTDEDSDDEVEFSRWCGSLDLVHNILPPSGPLSLSIFPPSDDVALIEAAINTIVIPYLPRISSLQFACTSFSGLDRFFALPENSLAEMRLLKLDCIQADEDGLHPTPSSVFIGARNLRDISLSGSRTFCDNVLGAQEVPWGQLIHLTLSLDGSSDDSLQFNLKYSKVLPVLSRCQNLVSLTLIFTEKAQSLISPQLLIRIVLPTLQKLNITILDSFPLTRFTLPSLIDLRIERACAFPTSELGSMIKRSLCRLKKFVELPQYHFPGMNCSMDDGSGLIDLYRSLKSLEYLCGSLKFSRALIEEVASGQIFPSLQTLFCRFETSTEDFLVALKPRLGWKDPSQVSYAGLRSVVGYIDECEGDTDGILVDEARTISSRMLAEYAKIVTFRHYCTG